MDFWTLTYALSLFGSVSFGYLLLRFGLPDIRMLPRQVKLGLSGFAGLLLFLFSAGLSYLRLSLVHAYVVMPLIVLVGLFFIFVKNFVAPSSVARVAVPVARVAAVPTPAVEKKSRIKVSVPRVSVPKVSLPKVSIPKVKKPRSVKAEKIVTKRKEEVSKEVEKAKQAIKKIVEKKEGKPAAKPVVSKRKHYRATEMIEAKKEGRGVAAGLSRRERYLKRRGKLVEQVKADLNKQQPLPELQVEELSGLELGEGIDLSDLETLSDLGELSEAADVDLSSLEEGGELDLSSLAGLAETEEIPKEKKRTGCPSCGAKNTTIVYCPYCGKAFCSNCSLKVHRKRGLVFYQCPHCKKEVIVKA